MPFILLHVLALGVFWTGISWVAVGVAVGLYLVRMFAITAFYHRYFSHRSFKTSRPVQFVFAVLGNSSAQRGPLWWAAHHRRHHQHTDTAEDVHSPMRHGFWQSHVLWFLRRGNLTTEKDAVKDWLRFPELVWLDRFYIVVPLLLFAGLYGLGWFLRVRWPQLGTSGLQLLCWGALSTVLVQQATFCINSVAHMIGRRRYRREDTSRNSFVLSLLTLGEGWHNNHHHYPIACPQGWFRGELDITWIGLRLLAACGLVSELRRVPETVRERDRMDGEAA